MVQNRGICGYYIVGMSLIEELKELIDRAARIVFLTGAGISTESGIPDFRSQNGIYSDPENVGLFEIQAFLKDPAPFYRFARNFIDLLETARPNPAHLAIARLQDRRRVAVATQNVDGLHQKAGSRTVYCVHGDFGKSHCVACGHRVATESLYPRIREGKVPRHACGGYYKPEVTFFGESLPPIDWENSRRAVEEADLLCVVGSSLLVYPAAGLTLYRRPDCPVVIINREPTPQDRDADLVIRDSAGEVLGALM